MEKRNEIVLFETEDKSISLPVALEDETVWLSQAQMMELFGRDQSVISRHIKNVFHENEVDEKSNMHFLHIANADRPVAVYSLDVIISVGYRVKSRRGVEFRKWANSVLKQYILKGYAVNNNRISQLGEVIRIMKRTEHELDSRQVLSVIEKYSTALELLDSYDHQNMKRPKGTATMFLYFLDKNGVLFMDGRKLIEDYTLVALTIMIAESRPEEKEMMVSVIMNCLGQTA